MRALLITDWMAAPGGAEGYITWVRDGLRAAGHEVRLLTSTAGSAGDGAAEYRAYGTNRAAMQAFLQIANPLAAAQVRSALRDFRPDVALVNMFEHHLSPAIFGPLRAVPTVLTVTDYKCICPIGSKLLRLGSLCTVPAGSVCWRCGCVSVPHWLRDQPRYALIRAAVQQADRVLSCSEWVRRELERNGIRSEFLALPVPAPGPDFRRAPAAEPLFVFCGRLDIEKGVALLLHAFAHVRRGAPAARLRIVGRGPERGALERLVNTLGLEAAVTFRGWVDPVRVELELADAWALVAPSLWAEPLGLVAVEAIVRGLPVIASRSGGFGETIQHGISGLLFPNGDELELTRHLLAIASHDAFPSHLVPTDVVQAMQAFHSVDRHIGGLQHVFREAAAGRHVR
jgi:glycosyltransferase involved in cell wall biosynthesis